MPNRLLLKVAWALWNGRSDVSLVEVVRGLHGDGLGRVSGLMIAISQGYEALDAWVESDRRNSS